ncbi:hypothetical protein FACS189483_08330 [Spirochaetia bacterium]|nr:hypothetical protein FACS189483_08330 [Spirochaetia bacterium]
MKKTVIIAVLLSALTIGSVSATETGVGGLFGYEGYVAGKFLGSGDASGAGYSYGGAFAYTNIPFGNFELGIEVGYQSKFTGILFAGLYGLYNFELVEGLAVYPKLGADFSLLLDMGLDIQAGAGISYDFTKLLGLGVVVRFEVLFDTYIGFGGNFFDPGAIALGPKFNLAVGYKL